MKPLLLSAGMGGFILLALGLRALAGKRLPARLFSWVWTLCAVRLLLPVALPCRLSLWGLFSQAQSTAHAALPAQASAAAPVTYAQVSVAEAVVKSARVSPAMVFRAVWLIGALALLGWFTLCHIRMVRALRAAKPAELGAQWCMEAGFSFHRKLSISILDDARAPLTYGVFRPVVVLPPALAAHSVRRRFALTHELVHVRRFDCLRKLLLTLALCLHWMNPALWLMVRAANRDLELACDECTLSILGAESRKAYCLMLLDFTATAGARAPLGSAFGQSATEERIKQMLKPGKASILTILLAVLLLLSSFSVLATQTPEVRLTPAARSAQQTLADSPSEISHAESVQTVEKTTDASTAHASDTATQPATTAQAASEPAWCWPCEDHSVTVTDSFGAHVHPVTRQTSYHYGTDLAAGYDTAVFAVRAGTVTEACYSPSAGYHVIIDHDGGWQSVYQHLHTMSVQEGDTVSMGDTIGAVGASGWATGPHLHIALLHNGEYKDPMQHLTR